MTEQEREALPPLPEPEELGMDFDKGWDGVKAYGYTADQMHAYARAALAEVDEENAQLREQNTAVDEACAGYEAENKRLCEAEALWLRHRTEMIREANELRAERDKYKAAAMLIVDDAALATKTNPAPGYCPHCKQYSIEEPLPAPAPEATPAWMAAFDAARDSILNDRGPLEGEAMNDTQTNAVLSILDEAFMPHLKREQA